MEEVIVEIEGEERQGFLDKGFCHVMSDSDDLIRFLVEGENLVEIYPFTGEASIIGRIKETVNG